LSVDHLMREHSVGMHIGRVLSLLDVDDPIAPGNRDDLAELFRSNLA